MNCIPATATRFAVAALLAGAGCGPAFAQRPPAGISDPAEITALLDCRRIAEDASRLACFDAAASRFDAARKSGELTVVDREGVRKAKRGLFGFSLSGLPLFGDRKDEADEVSEITLKVRSAQRTGSGWMITLESGATWLQADATMLGRSPRPGSTAVIRRGTLGSYKISIDGGPAFKARRTG